MAKSAANNKKDRVYHAIRDDIVAGVYPGGSFLVEEELCEKLNVSRTPVREALISLERDQFIELIPNRGAYVPHITLDDIVEILQLRKVCDGLAAWLAVEHQTPELLDALERSVNHEAELIAQKGVDPQEVSKEDFVFHNLLAEHCGNTRLKKMLASLDNQMRRVVTISADRYSLETLTLSLSYHKKTLEAFHTKDCCLAKETLEEHWTEMIKGYISRDLMGRMSNLL